MVMKEITKLACMLAKADIPFEIVCWSVAEGKSAIQVASPNKESCVVDAAYAPGATYGWERGLIEVLGTANPNKPNDDVVGYLTAKDVIEMIEKKWKRLFVLLVF